MSDNSSVGSNPGGIPANLIGAALAPQLITVSFTLVPIILGVLVKYIVAVEAPSVDPNLAAYGVIIPMFSLEIYYFLKKWLDTHSNDWMSIRWRVAGQDTNWDEDLMLNSERGAIRVLGKVVTEDKKALTPTPTSDAPPDGAVRMQNVTLAGADRYGTERLAQLNVTSRPVAAAARGFGLLAEFNFSNKYRPRFLAWVPYPPEEMFKFTGNIGLVTNPFMFVSRRVAKGTYVQVDWSREEDNSYVPMGFFSDYDSVGREAASSLSMMPTTSEVGQAWKAYDDHQRGYWEREAKTQEKLKDNAQQQHVDVKKEIRDAAAQIARERGAGLTVRQLPPIGGAGGPGVWEKHKGKIITLIVLGIIGLFAFLAIFRI